MKFNRTRWAGLAALALMGGLLAPVVTAPAAQAAPINVTDANCVTGQNAGAPITGDPGDIIGISANLVDCKYLQVDARLVSGLAALNVIGSNVSFNLITTPQESFWAIDSSTDFTSIEITLANYSGTVANGIWLTDNLSGSTETKWNVTVSGNPNPPTPTPTPAVPPSAPASAEATAGNGEVTVSWTAPTSQGSFPVTNYQVQSTPGSRGCVVPVTATTCRIAGLRNGTAYTFQVGEYWLA